MPWIHVVISLAVVAILATLINLYLPVHWYARRVVNVVVMLIVVGIVLWAINTYIPMAGSILAILNIVVVIATCVGVLKMLGLWDATVGLWRRMWHSLTTHTSEPAEPHHV